MNFDLVNILNYINEYISKMWNFEKITSHSKLLYNY